jgi:hypothetical protein
MTNHVNDLIAFRDFIDQKLAKGGNALTPAQCLDLWEIENVSDEERAATIVALREAIDDMRAGDSGMPADEFLAGLRRKYNLSAAP